MYNDGIYFRYFYSCVKRSSLFLVLISVDVRIPFYFEFVTTSIFFCITQIALVCFVYPLFSIAFIVIIVVFLSMDICMNKGVGMTKRLDNETKVQFLNMFITRFYIWSKIFTSVCYIACSLIFSLLFFTTSRQWFRAFRS